MSSHQSGSLKEDKAAGKFDSKRDGARTNMENVAVLREPDEARKNLETQAGNPRAPWYEKWWGDIVIGLMVLVFIFLAWLVTTPNAWCKIISC